MLAGIEAVSAVAMVASPEGSPISNFETTYPLKGSQVSACAPAENAKSATPASSDVRIMIFLA
jgi:hypothetical protein